MKCDTGRLLAYLDDALDAGERAEMSAHLDTCASCATGLADLRVRREGIAAHLAALEPAADEVPAPARALARFQAEHVRSRPTLWTVLRGGVTTMRNQLTDGNRWRPAAIGVSAVVILAILFSFAPVREAAADFLGLFRVRKFAVIPIDPAKGQQIETLAQMAEEGRFGAPTFVRQPGAEQTVSDAAQATTLAGFAVRTPADLPGGATSEIRVSEGPAVHYEMDRTTMQTLLDAAGVQGVTLPAVDRVTVDVDVPKVVRLVYRVPNGSLAFGDNLTLMQLPSPQIALPEGIDTVTLGEAAFRWLGMSEIDARRLAQSIDWTSTLVIPLPTDIGRYREVTVDGTTGLLLESADTAQRSTALVWQRGDIVYALNGQGIDTKVLLQVADSLE